MDMKKNKFNEIIRNKMNFKFKQIDIEAIAPKLNEDGSISLYATKVQQAVDATRKPVLVFHTGYEIILDNDYNLIAVPGKHNVSKSLSFESDMIVSSDYMNPLPTQDELNNKEFVVEYKITTDVMPVTYNAGDEVVRLFPVKKLDVTFDVEKELEMEEIVPEVEEVKEDK